MLVFLLPLNRGAGFFSLSERERERALKEILTAKEVAVELRCSRAQVYKLINGEVPGIQKLPAVPLGKKKKVVMRSSLEAWKHAVEIARISDRINHDSEVNAVDAVA